MLRGGAGVFVWGWFGALYAKTGEYTQAVCCAVYSPELLYMNRSVLSVGVCAGRVDLCVYSHSIVDGGFDEMS